MNRYIIRKAFDRLEDSIKNQTLTKRKARARAREVIKGMQEREMEELLTWFEEAWLLGEDIEGNGEGAAYGERESL